MFCTCSLPNVLLATAACNFSTSELQKVARTCSVFYILTWKCASRYSGVQAIFHFSSQQLPPHPPLYRGYSSTQPTHKSLKNTAFRDFPNISHVCIFFLLTFAQLYLLSSDSTSLLCFFHLLTLLLCSAFSTVHIVGSLTSKLPSIISSNSQEEATVCRVIKDPGPSKSSTVLKYTGIQSHLQIKSTCAGTSCSVACVCPCYLGRMPACMHTHGCKWIYKTYLLYVKALCYAYWYHRCLMVSIYVNHR